MPPDGRRRPTGSAISTLDRDAVLEEIAKSWTEGLLSDSAFEQWSARGAPASTKTTMEPTGLPARPWQAFVTAPALLTIAADATGSVLGRLTFTAACHAIVRAARVLHSEGGNLVGPKAGPVDGAEGPHELEVGGVLGEVDDDLGNVALVKGAVGRVALHAREPGVDGDGAVPDLVKRTFTATAPDQPWVAEMTYCRIFSG